MRLGDVCEHFTCRSGGRQLSNVHVTVGHLREKQQPFTGLDGDVRRFEGVGARDTHPNGALGAVRARQHKRCLRALRAHRPVIVQIDDDAA